MTINARTVLLMTLLFSTCLTTSSVLAKGEGRHHPMHEPNFEHMAEKLELTDAQTISFTEIMQEQHAKRRELLEGFHEDRKTAMDELRTETLESLASVLDEEQLEKIRVLMERRKKRHHMHKPAAE